MVMTERVVHVQPVIEPAGECPTCGFDSLRRISLYRLTLDGVTLLGVKTSCGRCKADERRAREQPE